MKSFLIAFIVIFSFIVLLGCVEPPIACTAEAKLCPDGTAVGRTLPDCEFAKCPDFNALMIDCNSFNYSDCPSECTVCPPCEVCSSVSCRSKEFCNGIGFDENWYNSVKPKEDNNKEIQQPIQNPAEEAILNLEKQLEETVCRILPTSAMHLNTNWISPSAILIPENFEEEVKAINSNLSFVKSDFVDEKGNFLNENFSGEKYYYNCWKDINQETHYCIIPITITFPQGTGSKTENGAIKLTFSGLLEPLEKDSAFSCPGGGDCGVPKCYPYCNAKPVSTFSRTGCEIDIEKPCPEKTDSVLCGQCEYKNFWDDATQISNLGQCRYCPKETKCSWSVSICGSFNCIKPNTANTNPFNLQKYFISCSGCQTGQRSYYYNGYNLEVCRYYSKVCSQNNCTDRKSNC